MTKRVISFRLSDRELQALNLACKRLGMNRSEAVSAGISVLLAEYAKDGERLIRRAPWISEPIRDSDDDDKS